MPRWLSSVLLEPCPGSDRGVDDTARVDEAAVQETVRRQHEDPEEHDRSLIAIRLRWKPEERLEANAAFVRWYLSLRPRGPLLR